MSLPPLEQRSTPNLSAELKKLRSLHDEIAAIAREKEMEPAFAEPLSGILDAIQRIEAEVASR